MYKNKIIAIVVGLFAIFMLVCGVTAFSTDFKSDQSFGCDLRLRRAEILCAHQGVNSFHIWNREMTLPGFVPWGRPDKEPVPQGENDLLVHAYPPWHTALFYFYGWLTERNCLSIMSLVWGLSLFFIVGECVRIAKEKFDHYGLVVGLSLGLIAFFAVDGFSCLNYGVPILAAFFLMNKSQEWGGGGKSLPALPGLS